MCGGRPIIVEPESDLSISVDNIYHAISPKTKAIIINTPSNPSGIVISEEKLSEIAALSVKNDLYVIADEVYKKLIYNCHFCSVSSFDGMKERTILVNSLSKEFCMTGWRLGYVVAPEAIINLMTKLQENVAACAPLPSQYAAIEALSHGDEYSCSMISEYEKRKNVLVEGISNISHLSMREPDATFYAMINIKETKMSSVEFAYKLLEDVHVALVPGVTYGKCCEGYVRIAFTLDEVFIREGIRRIKRFVDSL
jgi:aminotransferase